MTAPIDEARLRELADRLRAFRRLLKSGEYDGADLMRAWCAMVDAADGLEHLLDALSAERERGGRAGWKPIATAPIDGTIVDLFCAPEWANEPYPAWKASTPLGSVNMPAGKRIAGERFLDAKWCSIHRGWVASKVLHYVCRPAWQPTHWMLTPSDPATQKAEGADG